MTIDNKISVADQFEKIVSEYGKPGHYRVDCDGEVFWYVNEPRLVYGYWQAVRGGCQLIGMIEMPDDYRWQGLYEEIYQDADDWWKRNKYVVYTAGCVGAGLFLAFLTTFILKI